MKVECIKNHKDGRYITSLEVGKIYESLEIFTESKPEKLCLYRICIKDTYFYYDSDLFKPLSETRDEKINQILNKNIMEFYDKNNLENELFTCQFDDVDLISIEEFMNGVYDGKYTDKNGRGFYATRKYTKVDLKSTNIQVKVSDVMNNNLIKEFSHVLWFQNQNPL